MPTSPADRPELVGLHELLNRFPWLTERRLRSMVAENRVAYWKVQGRLLFAPVHFQEMVDAGYVPAASDA